MAKTAYHHGSLETALTTVALKVVKKSGMRDISLRDIAREVGVSASAVYRHFPSRDHLLVKVSQVAREKLAKDLLSARASVIGGRDLKKMSLDRFRAIGRAYVTFAQQQPRMFEAAFFLTDGRPDTEDNPSAWSILVEAIDEMVGAGAIPATRRHDAPLIAWAGVHGLATILTETAWPDGVDFTSPIDTVLDGVARAIS